MNREIKFRLRDENNRIVGYEKWYRGEFNMETKKDYYAANPCWLYSRDGELWNPQQIIHRDKDKFSGLHDKQGKEIYEGDIVLMSPGTFDVLIKRVVNFGCPIWEPLNIDDARTEVIGNIYEHPELIGSGGKTAE